MITLTRIIILAISAVYIISWLYPAYWNWSVMPLNALYPINIIFPAFAILFAVIPRLSEIVWDLKSRVWQTLMMKMDAFPMALKTALWIAIPAAFFFLIRSHSYILGDGNLILGNIVDGIPISSTAFGYSQLVSLLAELFAIETNVQAANLMAALSIICGVIYTCFLYKVLSLVVDDYKMRLWLFLIIFFSGLSVIFAGYVETYPILLAWLAIYLHSVIESLKYKSSILIPAGILAVGLFWHIWFLAFVPSLIWMINQRFNLLPRIFIFLFSAIYIVAIYIGGTFTSRSGIQTTLPLIPNDTTNYFLFSPLHFVDILNVIFIAGPVLGFIALVYLFVPSVYRQSENLRFFLLAAVPAFLISFMIDPVLGAPRDWDLLSIFALPAFLFAAVVLSNADGIKKKVYPLLIPILLLNVIHFASFAALNMKPERSVDRIVRFAHDDPHYQADYYRGQRIRIFAHLISNVYKRHRQGIEFLKELPDSEEIDCMSAISIANGYANMQDYETAEKYYSRVSGRCPMTSLDRMGYAKSLYMTRNFDRAIRQFKVLIGDTTAVPLYSFLGHSYIFENQTDSGVKYLDIAVSISDDSTVMMESLVDVLASDRRFEPALYFQKRLLQADPDSRLYQQRYNRLLELSGDTAQ